MSSVPSPPRVANRVAFVASALVACVLVSLLVPGTPASAQDEVDLRPTVIRTDGVEGRVISQANPLVDAEVWDIEFIGDTAYVAGKFLRVVRATSGWDRVDQPFLAAFDASTGAWVPEFRPALDGPVWALEEGPAGRLYAGGEFTTVNGEARTGLVALDPATGATDAAFLGRVERRFADSFAVVRDLHRHGDQLYAIGNFSHAIGGDTTMQAAKVARFDAATGRPDAAWVPTLAGRSGWAVETSQDGSTVFLAGEFTYINGAAGTSLFGAVDGTTGALAPGFDHGFNAVPRINWPLGGIVFDLARWQDRIFLTGAEHFWEIRSASTGASIQLTTQHDGHWFNDTQVVELEGSQIFVGCHCLRHWGYANHDVDPATGRITGTLTSNVTGGEGLWAMDRAPDGCLWVGGDLRGTTDLLGAPVDGTVRWVGRFARFCGPDGPPPPPEVEFDLVGSGDAWRVWAGDEWPAGWEAPAFDDAGWISASTQLGYGDGDEVTVVDDSARPAAVLARRSFVVDNPAAYDHLVVDLLSDDGTSVWINGQPVIAQNLGDGALRSSTLAIDAVFGAAERQTTQYLLPASLLVPGRNVIAASTHQSWAGSTDLSFDLALRASTAAADALHPSPAITLDRTAEQVVLRSFDDDAAYLEGTVDPDPDWTAVDFDDAAWARGTGSLGFGEDTIDTQLTQGLTTYYVRSSFTVDDRAAAAPASLELFRDDGVIVHLNGVELARDTMPAGPTDSSTRAADYIWGQAEITPVLVDIPAGTLRAGENVIAIAVHQAHPDSLDLRVDFEIRSTP